MPQPQDRTNAAKILAAFRDQTLPDYATNEVISTLVVCDPRTTMRNLRKLEHLGLLKITNDASNRTFRTDANGNRVRDPSGRRIVAIATNSWPGPATRAAAVCEDHVAGEPSSPGA